MTVTSRGLGLGVVLVGLGICWPAGAEPKQRCGPGQRPGINGCVDAAPRARLKNEPPAKARDGVPAPSADSSLRPPADERSPARAAERRLLVQELQQLEKLLQKLPANAPERAAILRRLAEAYADLARRAEYDREQARLRMERAKRDEMLERASERRPRAPARM